MIQNQIFVVGQLLLVFSSYLFVFTQLLALSLCLLGFLTTVLKIRLLDSICHNDFGHLALSDSQGLFVVSIVARACGTGP